MNTAPRKPEPKFSELNIHVSGQLFSREFLQALVAEALVPMLARQLLADATVQQALLEVRQARSQGAQRSPRDTAQMLTINDVAERLGIRPVTVRSWIAARKIPMVKVGRCVRVPAEAVQHFIETNTVPATQQRA